MEHAQRAIETTIFHDEDITCLNPYFNGTCSKSFSSRDLTTSSGVLILILMEHAQRVLGKHHVVVLNIEVLILILMEHAQRVGLWLIR